MSFSECPKSFIYIKIKQTNKKQIKAQAGLLVAVESLPVAPSCAGMTLGACAGCPALQVVLSSDKGARRSVGPAPTHPRGQLARTGVWGEEG